MNTNYRNISQKQAYEWVKTGHWSYSQFAAWFVEKEKEANKQGSQTNENTCQ